MSLSKSKNTISNVPLEVLFERSLKDRLANNTIYTYKNIFKRLIKDGKIQIRSRSMWVKVCAVIKYAKLDGLISKKKTFGVPKSWSRNPIDPRAAIRDNIVDEDRFLSAIAQLRPGVGKVDEAILAMRIAFYSGLRSSEILGLNKSDISFGSSISLSVIGKGGIYRDVYLPHHMLDDMKNFSPFSISRDALYLWVKKAGIKNIHALRHSFATRIANSNKIPLHHLQGLLGHKSITTTMIYTQIPRSLPIGLKDLGY